ncbi:MAG: hypothetical protein BGO67_04000 [Alphaproteobacteria bacterium 41-28]|nr:MAG: hypothetical protein BGO67_04000 [Alphaproteobacteria bacterium 41-28]
MNKNQKQDSLQEMLSILKEDYNFLAKLWVIGKVIKEWTSLIIGAIIFILIVLFILFAIRGGSKIEYVNNSQQTVLLPMKDIVTFMAICQRSINKRQEIFKSLMEILNLYPNGKLYQKDLEEKARTISTIANTCNTARSIAIMEFTRIRNPFEDPDVSKAFDQAIENRDDFFKRNNEVLNFQKENEQWRKLCELCQDEVRKANQELAQILGQNSLSR